MERCVVLEQCQEARIEIGAIAVSDLLFIHMCGGTWRELRALFLIKPTMAYLFVIGNGWYAYMWGCGYAYMRLCLF